MTKTMDEGAKAPPAPVKRAPQVMITKWKGEQEFESSKPGGPAILIDSHGKSGPGPMEVLMGAMAACAATDVVEILAKRRTPAESLEVETVGTRVETTPRRLEHVLLKFRIKGNGIERIHAERAIDLAVTKYCSVGGSLDPRITVKWELALDE
jgi:putative redox protein